MPEELQRERERGLRGKMVDIAVVMMVEKSDVVCAHGNEKRPRGENGEREWER